MHLVYGENQELFNFCFQSVFMPNDGQRLKSLEFLIDQGFADRLLISHDICKQRLNFALLAKLMITKYDKKFS